MADAAYSSTRSRRQRDLSNIPGFDHSRRSWTGNGMRMTMETATYASPGFSFRSNTNDGTNIFSDFMQPTRNSSSRGGGSGGLLGGGLLGGAINLLNNVANPQSRQPRPRTTPERRSYIVESDEVDSDVTSSDEDLAYGSLPRARIAQPKSVLGRVKDRILEHGRQHHEEAPPSRPRETRSDRRRARPPSPEAPRARTRRRSSIFNYERTPESSPERRTHARPPQTKGSHDNHAEREVAILQRAVEDERKEYLGAKQRFQHASQRSVIDAEHIQDLLNQVKVHGARLASAQRKLQLAKEQRQQRDTATRATRQRTQRRPSPPREAYYESDEDEEHFEPEFRRSFTAFGSIPRSNVPFDEPIRHTGVFDPLFGFRVFDRLFSEADASFSVHGNASGFHFSTASGNDGPTFKRTNFASTSTPHGANRPRPGPRPQQYTTTQQPTPQLPRNPLRATEAARLFASYDSTWNALSATLTTIPYPTRTLLAAAITDPSTIPHQLAHTWSTEHIMQANTALFFVLASGLAPVISDAGVVTFNRLATSEGELKGLISVLKKEKMRWHSDRLGRRNEGVADGGVNTALQRDERARAVFHGVCALMEFALGRTG